MKLRRNNLFHLSCIFLVILAACGSEDSDPIPPMLTIASASVSGFTIAWDDSGNPITIQVSSNVEFSSLAFEATFDQSPQEVTGLSSMTGYFVRYAFTSNVTNFSTTQEASTTELTVPSEISVSDIFGDSFDLSWAPVLGATFGLDVALDDGFTNMIEGYDNLVIDQNEITVDVPQKETTYYFRVKSINGSESSSYSSVGTATTNDRIFFRFSSDGFSNGGTMPAIYSCRGVSPPLAWRGAPENTITFALIMDDLDFNNGFNHWIIFNIPSNTREIPEGASGPGFGTGVEGSNHLAEVGYFGPCPPAGESHRYEFTLYALDGPINLQQTAFNSDLLSAMNGHILAKKTITGLYF